MNGREPRTGLLKARNGRLLGTTRIGGQVDGGALFHVCPGSEIPFTSLRSFSTAGGNGARPRSPLVLGNDGFSYGTTFGGGTNDQGTIFRYWPGH